MVLVPRLRRASSRLLEGIASRLPPYPNAYTIMGLVLVALASLMGILGHYAEAFLAAVVGVAMDAIDGAVARRYGLASRLGAVLDSITDRVEDALLAAGLWNVAGAQVAYLLGVASLIHSYARARGEAEVCRKLEGVGLLERGERTPLILAAYLLASLAPSIARLYTLLVAVLIAAAAAARIVQVLRLIPES